MSEHFVFNKPERADVAACKTVADVEALVSKCVSGDFPAGLTTRLCDTVVAGYSPETRSKQQILLRESDFSGLFPDQGNRIFDKTWSCLTNGYNALQGKAEDILVVRAELSSWQDSIAAAIAELQESSAFITRLLDKTNSAYVAREARAASEFLFDEEGIDRFFAFFSGLQELVIGRGARFTITSSQAVLRFNLPSRDVRDPDSEYSARLGPFRVRLLLSQLGAQLIRMTNGQTVNVANILDIYSDTPSEDGYQHPHVEQSGVLCFGDGKAVARNLFQQCFLSEVVDLINSILSTYSPGNAYTGLDTFGKGESGRVECVYCGSRVDEADVYTDYRSGEPMCPDCMGEDVFGHYHGQANLRKCSECGGYQLQSEIVVIPQEGGGPYISMCTLCHAKANASPAEVSPTASEPLEPSVVTAFDENGKPLIRCPGCGNNALTLHKNILTGDLGLCEHCDPYNLGVSDLFIFSVHLFNGAIKGIISVMFPSYEYNGLEITLSDLFSVTDPGTPADRRIIIKNIAEKVTAAKAQFAESKNTLTLSQMAYYLVGAIVVPTPGMIAAYDHIRAK